MQQYIAFLRGINVGGHRVKMDRLRTLFEGMGFSNVSTFIASGNVIFSSASPDVRSLRETIERRLAEQLGYEVETFIRSPSELATVAAFEPAEDSQSGRTGSSLYVIFLHTSPGTDLRAALAGLNSNMDCFTVSGREIYWQIQGKMSESPLFGTGIKAMRAVPNTTRNVTTLRRLITRLGTGS